MTERAISSSWIDFLGHENMGEVIDLGSKSMSLKSAICPTGPQPQISTGSPRWIGALTAAMEPVGKMSDRKSAYSSVTLPEP